MNATQLDLIDLTEAKWPQPVYLRRIDLTRKMRRFYTFMIERDLFDRVCVVTEYGRIGRSGRVTRRIFASAAEAVVFFTRTQRQKERRGYHA